MDLPSTHDITTYIYNMFLKFVESLKKKIMVRITCFILPNLSNSYFIRLPQLAVF